MVSLIFIRQCIMPWCLLNINVLGCGTKLLLGVLRGQNLKKFSYFFPISGWEFLFISYFLATVIPIFLFSKCHLSLDTLVRERPRVRVRAMLLDHLSGVFLLELAALSPIVIGINRACYITWMQQSLYPTLVSTLTCPTLMCLGAQPTIAWFQTVKV